MKIVLLGPPGSGKGTQAKILSEKLGLKHISTGDLLREETKKETPLSKKIKEILDEGKLISDEFVFEILKQNLPSDNYILDGLPRTVSQAKMLDDMVKIDFIFLIDVEDEFIVERIVNRRMCPKCGRIYNLKTNKPKNDTLCDVCSVPLIQRDDDNEEVVRKRLSEYHNQTEPVLDYYSSRLIRIDGEKPIEEVTQQILSKINRL
ncbi:MAG: adenylate kinase [Candidatus Woesearchaeota archaeon]|nr:adenylate kinase [Candidatus Woesearchaeota archaeon]MDN5327946.1 adenylate kinase [Candidatus Woesearchaeota archaeon]